MPLRQSKRAQREEADAARLRTLAQRESESEEEPNDASATNGVSGFAALAIDDRDTESPPETDSAPRSGAKKKKKRKAKADGADQSKSTTTTAKASAPVKAKIAPLDEIDAAIRDINAKYAISSEASTKAASLQTAPATTNLRSLLACSAKDFDADAELRRMFGSKVVNASANQPVGRRGAGAHNPHHKAGRARSTLAKPTSYWPPIHLVKSGLTMEPVDDQKAEGIETWHSFEHSRAYKEAQSQFLQAVSSHDPNAIFALLAVQPYHIDSLLQLADIQAHQGDQGQAEDFLDRALYAMERAMSPTFQLTGGAARLSFRRIESRAMFRACERKVTSLMRRGCWRTAFEFARLLLALSPFDDPYGALLFLDFLAPKTKQTQFLQNLCPALSESAGAAVNQPLRLETYPGLAFGLALALFEGEKSKEHKESSDALVKAIRRFPSVVLLLYDKLDLSYPKSIATMPRAQAPPSISTGAPLVWILAQLYVHRSESLWKAPEVKSWLQAAVNAAESRLDDQSDADVALGWNLMQSDQPYGPNAIPHGIARHILAADIAHIKALLPSSILRAQSYSYDLLAPVQDPRATFYDSKYFQVLGGGQARSARRAVGALDVQRLVDLLHANGEGPQGANLDELQAIMAQLTEIQERGGGMPGGLGTQNNLDEGEDEDHSLPSPVAADERGDVAGEAWPLREAPAALFNWFRQWGGRDIEDTDDDDIDEA